jgi:hypothetical protein
LLFCFADPGCLSQIPNPDFYPSRIPDPKTATKERGKKISCHTFFCGHKYQKIENYFIFEMRKKKNWGNFQRIIEHFTQKFVTKLSQILVRDPGSEIRDPRFRIRDPEKTYSGSRIQGQKGTGSRIRIRNTAKQSVLSSGKS